LNFNDVRLIVFSVLIGVLENLNLDIKWTMCFVLNGLEFDFVLLCAHFYRFLSNGIAAIFEELAKHGFELIWIHASIVARRIKKNGFERF